MNDYYTELANRDKTTKPIKIVGRECYLCVVGGERILKRLTEKTIGCFEYSLKDHKPVVGGFADYDTFFDYSMAVRQLGKLEDMLEPRPMEEWHEDDGDCLFWCLPDIEPPYCGTPDDVGFPSHVTHFTRLIMPFMGSE